MGAGLGWANAGAGGGVQPIRGEKKGKRDERKEGREEREERGEKRGGKREREKRGEGRERRVGLTCHVDAILAFNDHFNTV